MNDYIIYHANNFSTAGDGFTEVAVVSAYNMSDAYRLSNNIESSWIENPEVLLQCELPKGQDGLRSTSSGDVTTSSSDVTTSASDDATTASLDIDDGSNDATSDASIETFSNMNNLNTGRSLWSLDLLLKSVLFACLFYVLAHNKTRAAVTKFIVRGRENVSYVLMLVFAVVYYLLHLVV